MKLFQFFSIKNLASTVFYLNNFYTKPILLLLTKERIRPKIIYKLILIILNIFITITTIINSKESY